MNNYMDFSELTELLGFSGKTLYSISNHIYRHYRPVTIPKKNGESRQLYVPDKLLKTVQRSICRNILSKERISDYATAYKPNASTFLNASPHTHAPLVLKLDIRQFFDHLIYPLIKQKVFPSDRFSEQIRVLLTILCVYNDSLPQGAPTSPVVSNIIMRDFDDVIGDWCMQRNIVYTRYCDDMTFSGDFDKREVIEKVRTELKKSGLFLNDKKTVCVNNGQRQCVTGIVVNEKISIPKAYKSNIRKEMYFISKFGIDSHMKITGVATTHQEYINSLMGKINYVISVERDNADMKKYLGILNSLQCK